ncbi:GNAT family N-acetyltransferase [Pseudonocardia acaciae]|uniref:GNAT family N-acetyltransferase n=1 Tax=Pseudonocardia acaciae TaxID=551276 RepID=UPI00048E959F|nr:GNAT family N-acetyltransferase [Pseudonocardia acaciae]
MTNTLRLRSLTDEELSGIWPLLANAFLMDYTPEGATRRRDLVEPERYLGVFDEHRQIGGGAILTKNMTLPGVGPTPVAAVSYVGVRPDERGRGALTALMRAQLDGLHDGGREPVAALWASMAPLYGRFGYGLASRKAAATVTTPAPFVPSAPQGGVVKWFGADEVAETLRAVHAAVAASRVGWVSRPKVAWRTWLADDERDRGGCSAYRYAVHRPSDGGEPDGYAVFRAKEAWPESGPDYELEIRELVAATGAAHAGLWRSLLDVDLVGRVRHSNVALDDPLPLLLRNPRVLGEVSDALWVRLVDLDRALAARRYAAPCDVVLEVADRFCPWNAGRWRLKTEADGGAHTERTSAPADLECDTADLAAAYLGGTRLTALAAAGRVRELRPGAVVAASRALATDTEPHCPEIF